MSGGSGEGFPIAYCAPGRRYAAALTLICRGSRWRGSWSMRGLRAVTVWWWLTGRGTERTSATRRRVMSGADEPRTTEYWKTALVLARNVIEDSGLLSQADADSWPSR